MRGLIIGLGALLIVALLAGGCAVQGYNEAIRLDTDVARAWAQVENQLQRRFDLIPNLVETVKGVAQQEQTVFGELARARAAYANAATIAGKAQAAGELNVALGRLMILQENYPQLRSNESFLKLQDSLEGTENRIAVERQRYNEQVQVLDTFMRQLPTSFYAQLAGIERPQYFQIDSAAKSAPKVDFAK